MNKSNRITDCLQSAYIQAIYFTDTGEEGQPGADLELSSDALEHISQDIHQFWDAIWDMQLPIDVTFDRIGHDFWLTRQGHGAGFWDSPELYGKHLSDALTKIAEDFGPVYTYESDDHQIEMGV